MDLPHLCNWREIVLPLQYNSCLVQSLSISVANFMPSFHSFCCEVLQKSAGFLLCLSNFKLLCEDFLRGSCGGLAWLGCLPGTHQADVSLIPQENRGRK